MNKYACAGPVNIEALGLTRNLLSFAWLTAKKIAGQARNDGAFVKPAMWGLQMHIYSSKMFNETTLLSHFNKKSLI